MPTECSADLFGFAPVEGRAVVAAFDAGAVTSDAGALLLGRDGSRDQDDGPIGLVFSRRAVPGVSRAPGGGAGRPAGVRDCAWL